LPRLHSTGAKNVEGIYRVLRSFEKALEPILRALEQFPVMALGQQRGKLRLSACVVTFEFGGA